MRVCACMKDSRATNDGIMSTLKKQNPNTTESERYAKTKSIGIALESRVNTWMKEIRKRMLV